MALDTVTELLQGETVTLRFTFDTDPPIITAVGASIRIGTADESEYPPPALTLTQTGTTELPAILTATFTPTRGGMHYFWITLPGGIVEEGRRYVKPARPAAAYVESP